MKKDQFAEESRRSFIGKIATGVVAAGAASVAPLTTGAKTITQKFQDPEDPDQWFSQIKGKHRIVFDVPEPNELSPFAWPRVFLMTNEITGTKMKDSNVVVVLRHAAIPFAMDHALWSKYHFGEVFKINDPQTKEPALRNAFWQPKEGDFQIPGVGNVPIGINELQESGVMFAVCNMALTVYSAAIAQQMKLDAKGVYNEWVEGLLPKVQLVPSGVWAIGRAQEHGCAYCFAG
jgi:intracellular sulfur oxidation DsrE/DsrF family protein